MLALIVPHDDSLPLRHEHVGADLAAMQQLVGGWLEAVTRIGGGADWHAYVDENGLRKRLGPNRRATVLAHVLGWLGGLDHDLLVGDAVFVGANSSGEEADVPARVVETAQRLQYEINDESEARS